jgi:hypothetical protein
MISQLRHCYGCSSVPAIRMSVALISRISPVVIWRADDRSRNCSAYPRRFVCGLCCRSDLIPTIGSSKHLDPVFDVLESHFLPAYCFLPQHTIQLRGALIVRKLRTLET